MADLVLTLSCPDRRGIVAAVAGRIADGGGNIVDSHQFGDPDAERFFMRIHFASDDLVLAGWRDLLRPLADDFAMSWDLHDLAVRTGHSHTTPVCLLARNAGVQRLVMTHFDPHAALADPVDLDKARSLFAAAEVAEDGMVCEF